MTAAAGGKREPLQIDAACASAKRDKGEERLVYGKKSLAARYASLAFAILPAAVALLIGFSFTVLAEQRFPPPDFEGGHQLPILRTPAARALFLQYLDVAVLAASLGVAAWLVYRKRSRKWVMALSIFSLLYFGFWRKGCVCSIGSLQNVALALADPGYAIPIGITAFFILPLAFSLFGGRTFCAGVCPHGALQDLVLLKPIEVPNWLEQALSVLPYVYLGAGVLFAATGSAFIICQYDPFVPIFRMSGRVLMVLAGAGLLLLGMFVGRPYCRFLCPYGALLKIGATLSKWRVRVTPNTCNQCRLCEHACPFGAMRVPETAKPEQQTLLRDRRRFGWLLAVGPVLIVAGALLGNRFSVAASRLHPTVSLAERLVREADVPARNSLPTADDLALDRARQSPTEIMAEAKQIQHRFLIGSSVFGGWVGLVIGWKLLGLGLRRQRTDYEPDAGACYACARCFEYCPNELTRRGIVPQLVETGVGAPSLAEAARRTPITVTPVK